MPLTPRTAPASYWKTDKVTPRAKYIFSDDPHTCRPTNMRAIGSIVRAKRCERKLSHGQLSEMTGISVQDIKDVEWCVRDLTLLGYAKLCRAFNIEFGEMLSEIRGHSSIGKLPGQDR